MIAKITKERIEESKSQEKKRKKDEKLQESIEKRGNISLIGELLKRQREFLDLSQKDISNILDYQYMNFISMIENGACKIPLKRIPDIAKAYSLPPEFTMILTKELHPETWAVICAIKENNKAFNSGIAIEDIEKNMNAIFKGKLKEFRLPMSSV